LPGFWAGSEQQCKRIVDLIGMDSKPLAELTDGIKVPSSLIQIFGPCSAESKEQVLDTGHQIAKYFPQAIFRAGVWKPRTRPGTFEGAGEPALDWMVEVRERYALEPCTEVATPQHVEAVLKRGFKHVWIGARTTVNPFLVQELAHSLQNTEVRVFVKNPINPDLGLWMGAIERFKTAGIDHVLAIHRGFQTFETEAYRYSPRWELVIDFMSRMPEIPMICDISHISGDRKYLFEVAQKALDMDYKGLMIETHPQPEAALSDAKQQIKPNDVYGLFKGLVFRSATVKNSDFDAELNALRARVDAADDMIMQGLILRKRLIEQIGQHKKVHHVQILQIKRWEQILLRQMENGANGGLDTTFVKRLYELLHEESIRVQTELFSK
jgi:chorismate mutase